MPSTGIELGVKNFWIAGSMFFAADQYRTEKLLSMQGCLEGARGAMLRDLWGARHYNCG